MEKNLGHATAYGYAKSKGYSGTEDEFAQLMADYASVGQSAAQSAEQAAASATSASGSASTAASAAQTATSKAEDAIIAEGVATAKAEDAQTYAISANQSAWSASTSAQTATNAAATATTKASEASESATTATNAKTDAETARDAAVQSASEAAVSAASIDPATLEHRAYGAYVVESATGAIASFPDGADDIPMKDVIVHIEPVQAGSGDPSPDNVRPITGWTGAKVARTGRNMLPPAVAFTETNNGVTLTSDGRGNYTVIGATGDNSASFTFDLTGTLAWNGTEYVHLRNTIASSSLTFSLVDKARSTSYWGFAPINRISNLSDVIWAKKGQVINKLNVYVAKNTTVDFTISPSVELSGDATSYEPYSGQTYDITFPSEAGTVYGGTLDVTSGVLTVDRAMVKKSVSDFNETSSTSTTGGFFIDVAPYNSGTFVSWNDNLSNIAVNSNTSLLQVNQMYVQSGFRVQLKTAYTSKDELVSAMGDNLFEFCGKLVTPITYQLTTQEITSLLGTNNLWADTGDSEVEYRANTELWVQRKITEAVAAVLNS